MTRFPRSIRILQRDVMDCGAACLASVAAFYRLQLPVALLRQYAGTQQQGTNLLGLQQAAERIGFQAKGVRVPKTSAAEIPLPAIYHLVLGNGLQHFVVGYRRKKESITYMDPALGKMVRLSGTAFGEKWSGVVLLLVPGVAFRSGNRKASTPRRFAELLHPHRGMLLQALLGAILYTLLGLSMSLFVQKIVDFVLPDNNLRLLNGMGCAMVLLALVQGFAGYVKSLIALRTGQQIDVQLILGYYRHLLRLPLSFFDGMRVGEIISRVNDALRIRYFINDTALGMLVNALTACFSLAAMFAYFSKLACLVIVAVPFYGVLYYVSDRINQRYQRRIMEQGAALESQLVETVTGMGTVKRFGAEDWAAAGAEARCIPMMRTVYRSTRSGLLLQGTTEGCTRLLTIAVLWAGSYAVAGQALSPGALLSFYALTAYFTEPVISLIAANRTLQDAFIAADRLFEVTDLATEPEDRGLRDLPAGDIDFRAVAFGYCPGQPVFEALQCRFERGKMTAVLGESGSGKSTLAALLLRLYEPGGGGIYIGETDLRRMELPSLRRQIAVVPQQTELFQGTVVENIALADPDPDLVRLGDLCLRLGLEDFIRQLPGQWQARISESGTNLSGGQRQRIALARALYRDPSILILDEATAALDTDSETRVQQVLRWFAGQGRTIIMIAHRLSSTRDCDHILLLQQGRVAAEGTHETLFHENATYRHWWQQQAGLC